MKKTIPSLRVDERTLSNLDAAVIKYNKKNLFKITRSDLIRLGLEIVSQLILKDQELPVVVSDEL